MRNVKTPLWMILAVGFLLHISLPAVGQDATSTDAEAAVPEAGAALATEADPPPGYKSMAAVQAAILTGKLKLIDGEIEVPDSVLLTQDIEYGQGGGESLKLDLYQRKGLDHPVPAILFIHGGGWSKGGRNDYHFYCVKFAELGYVVATASYRLVPEWQYPAAVHDVKCAVRWLRANAMKYHIDPEMIGVAGGSAGGHLSMMVGYSSDVPELEGDGGNDDVSSQVQAVVNLYGPTDLTVPVAAEHPTVLAFFGDNKIDEVRTDYEQASPLTHVTEDDPPTLIIQGTIDDLVPVSQADALALKLHEVGVPFRYDRLTGWPHTLDLAEVINVRCRRLMREFFAEYLPLPQPSQATGN